MIEKVEYVTPDGETFKLHGVDMYSFDFTGFGMPDIKYIEQQSPLQHGVTYYDYRLQPRVIQLTVRRNDCSREDYWTNRNTILDMLRPNRQLFGQFALGTLKQYLPDNSIRAIDVMIQQGPVFTHIPQGGPWDEYSYQESIRFIAPDPTWYDPTQEVYSKSYTCTGYHVLPFSFQVNGELTFDEEGDYAANWDVEYLGTWLSYPTFVINGPLSNPVIWNLSTEKKIDFSSYNIAAGEQVTVTLEFGNKTIESDINGNLINYVSDDSDLADFYIACDPEATDGDNNVTIFGDGALSGNTSMYLYFYTRYIGI